MFFTHVLLPEQTCLSTLNLYIYEINKLAWVIPHLISAQMWSSSLSLHRCQISTLKLPSYSFKQSQNGQVEVNHFYVWAVFPYQPKCPLCVDEGLSREV